MDNLNLEKQLVEKLSIVRDEFIANKEQLAMSIRRDIVAAELRDILASNPDFYQLKAAIEDYADNLVDLKNLQKGEEDEQQ